jgi:hypothetical protein
MDHHELLERAIDAQLNPLAKEIARECNQEVGEVLRAIEAFKQAAIDRLIEAQRSSTEKLSDDDINIIIAAAFNECLGQTTTP